MAFRLKTFPEILANMFATARALIEPTGKTIDLAVGSFNRTYFEAAAMQDADQYVQIGRLLDLFGLDSCKGNDLDRRAVDLGALLFPALRRQPAKTSLVLLTVSDGALLALSQLAAAVAAGATTFACRTGDGVKYSSSGAIVIDRGTEREEQVVYTRSGDNFTVVYPATGFQFAHPTATEIVRISTRSQLLAGIAAGALSCQLLAGTGPAWPTSGTVILEQGTAREERVTFTRSTGSDVLTFGAGTLYAHAISTEAKLSTNGSDRTIANVSPYAPATQANKQVNFRLLTTGVLLDGDLTSGLIQAESDVTGRDTRVAASTVTKWVSPPFSNATVTNPFGATRGQDREDDDTYRQRLKDYIQSLSRGTALAIETLVTGLTDSVSSQEVAFAQVVEPVVPGTVSLYITTGDPTFALDQQVLIGRDVLISDADTGDRRAKLGAFAPFRKQANPLAARTPRIFKSSGRGDATSVGPDYLEDTTQAWVVNAYAGMYLKTDDDQFYLIASNTAIRLILTAGGVTPSLGAYSVFDFAADPLEPDVDYQFNESTGHLELTTALAEHDGLVAASDGADPSVGAYTYTTGLGAFVQRSVNGDPTDFEDFPGIKATGTKVLVMVPVVFSPQLKFKVVAARGFTDVQLAPAIKAAAQTYVNSLGIGGEDKGGIIMAKIIDLAMEVPGVQDFVSLQSANIPVPAGQLPRITDADVEVL